MRKNIILDSALILAISICLSTLVFNGSALAGWRYESRINLDSYGKQASRGGDCPWSLSVDMNDRVHVVWEDRRQGRPLRIYYRGKDPDPTWNGWDSSDYELSLIDSVEKFGHPSIMPLQNGKLFSVYVEERFGGGELFGSWISNHPSEMITTEMVSDEGGRCLTFSSTGWQTTIAVYGDRAITFWPYVQGGGSVNLPIYFKIYENDAPLTNERPINLPGFDLDYLGVNLSARAGSDGKVYLACRLITEDFPVGHIFLFKLDMETGSIVSFDDLTPGETRPCLYPYIAVMPAIGGRDIVYVTFELGADGGRAVFVHNKDGSWSSPIPLSPDGISTGHPCLAVCGKYVDFVYERPNSSPNTQIQHRRFDPFADTLSAPIQVTHSDYFNLRPVLASDSYGNLHLTYITNRENPDRNGDEEVYYSMFDAPPSAPIGLRFDKINEKLIWQPNREPDILHYDIEVVGNGVHYTVLEPEFRPFPIQPDRIRIRAVDLNGQVSSPTAVSPEIWSNQDQARPLPERFSVGSNYPNPFNAVTAIPMHLEDIPTAAAVEIFDIKGRLVGVIGVKNSGDYNISWGGRDFEGNPLASGVYFYRLRVQNAYGPPRRMTLLR